MQMNFFSGCGFFFLGSASSAGAGTMTSRVFAGYRRWWAGAAETLQRGLTGRGVRIHSQLGWTRTVDMWVCGGGGLTHFIRIVI